MTTTMRARLVPIGRWYQLLAAGLRDGNEEASNACEKPVQNSSCKRFVSLDTTLITASQQ